MFVGLANSERPSCEKIIEIEDPWNMVSDIREAGVKTIETEICDRDPHRCYVRETGDRGEINESVKTDRHIVTL